MWLNRRSSRDLTEHLQTLFCSILLSGAGSLHRMCNFSLFQHPEISRYKWTLNGALPHGFRGLGSKLGHCVISCSSAEWHMRGCGSVMESLPQHLLSPSWETLISACGCVKAQDKIVSKHKVALPTFSTLDPQHGNLLQVLGNSLMSSWLVWEPCSVSCYLVQGG